MTIPPCATNCVHRAVDGRVTTASGRRIPQPPGICADDPGSAAAYDAWLIEQGRIEAAELDDAWMVGRLAHLEPCTGSALRHLLSDFLFGQPDPAFDVRTGPAPAEPH